MKHTGKTEISQHFRLIAMIIVAVGAMLCSVPPAEAQTAVHRHHAPVNLPVDSISARRSMPANALPDSILLSQPLPSDRETIVVEDEFEVTGNSLHFTPVDTLGVLTAGEAWQADSIARQERNAAVVGHLDHIPEEEWVPRAVEFSPDPNRAVWLSALFPGLGQIYNRRYWKLPIIVGGYLGLGYATSWNNQMLKDYSRAYSDILDNDPSTKSYMDFFAPNVQESDLDKTWLTNLLRSRKNYFRRNRDLCIISMVGIYLLAMVDAYVDASLSHFDISPQLSMDVVPALIPDGNRQHPSLGLCWALNF